MKLAGRDVQEWMRAEVACWPGAAVEFIGGKRHNKARVTFGPRAGLVVMSASASDWRADANRMTDLRRVLRGLGAMRASNDNRRSEA